MSDLDEADASNGQHPKVDPVGSETTPPASGLSQSEADTPEVGPPESEGAAELGTDGDVESEAVLEPVPKPFAEELLAAERDQHLSDLQRVTAEFANFRKQTDKRNAETVRQAAARVMQAILPVLDAAVLQQVEGVEPIAVQLRSVLEAQGLEVIDQAEAFDPNRHEAAISEPGDDDQDGPMVAEVLRTGYAFNGRVLRAAMVRVKG